MCPQLSEVYCLRKPSTIRVTQLLHLGLPQLSLIYELILIMDLFFLILMSEYTNEDNISREFDADKMVGLSE